MVDIPDDIDLVDYDDEDHEKYPEEDLEGDPEEDVEIELENDDEEVDVASEATIETINQKPYATSSWALRRDLEASRARAREMEAK
ncbi:hypothetical protein Tco_0235338 [Tanacetum coccineum]